MHLKTTSLTAASLAGLFLAAALPASAQTAVDTAQSATTTQQLQKPILSPTKDGQAPYLYEGEVEDIGPQYVLQPHERPKYVQIMGDLQLYHTDNAALALTNKVGTDVTVFTVQVAVQSQAKEIANGIVTQLRAGFRYQSYWYGIFSGRNNSTAPTAPGVFSPVKDLDFVIYQPFVEATFKKDAWYGNLGLRYAAFYNTNSRTAAAEDRNFYQEWVPSGTVGYQLNLDSQRIIQLQYDGDFRGTHTDQMFTPSAGQQPTGWQDRTDHAVSLIFSHIVGEHWVFQPAYRIMYTKYTNDARARQDIYNTLSFMVAYYFNEYASARAFTSIEWRNSSYEAGVDNSYQVWNLGIGASLNVSF